jgi:hypothetical protein
VFCMGLLVSDASRPFSLKSVKGQSHQHHGCSLCNSQKHKNELRVEPIECGSLFRR